jgi:ABC-2 type transport system ATP-binding protein
MVLGVVIETAVYEARGLTRTFPGAPGPVVDAVDCRVEAGEVFGVLGRNGAGKSTLVRMLVGLLHPDDGRVRLCGTDVTGQARHAAERVAYLPQHETALDDMTVRTAMTTTARLRGVRRRQAHAQTERLLDELGMAALADARMTRLSGGQRRLAAVACSLTGDRRVLVLDEPTTGLDLDARRVVWSALERRRTEYGAAVVLVTHNVAEAEAVLDRVLVLHAGRAGACGTPGRLKERFGGQVRLDLTWRNNPASPDLRAPMLGLAGHTVHERGRRWTVRLPAQEAHAVLGRVLSCPVQGDLEDFTLAPPSLEDVLLTVDAGGDPR